MAFRFLVPKPALPGEREQQMPWEGGGHVNPSLGPSRWVRRSEDSQVAVGTVTLVEAVLPSAPLGTPALPRVGGPPSCMGMSRPAGTLDHLTDGVFSILIHLS